LQHFLAFATHHCLSLAPSATSSPHGTPPPPLFSQTTFAFPYFPSAPPAAYTPMPIFAFPETFGSLNRPPPSISLCVFY